MAIIFDVGFKADARGLSQSLGPQLATIKSEIQEAFNSVPRAGGMQQSLQKAVHQAQILENTLKRATTDKGISMVSLNAGLAKAGTTATQLITTLGMAGPEFAGSFNVALTSLATANTRAITLGSKLKEAAHVFTQNFKYSFAASTYQSLTKSLSEAVAWAKDLNKELTTISIVSGKTGASLDAVSESVVKGANKLGIAAKDYAQASTIFYQQGLGTKEVERRSDITIKAAKAAGTSVSEMSSQLTAVWNTYRMQGNELERAASIGAKLAASTAVEFNDIAEAMQYSATAASQMGVSYESLAAMISTVGDTTQQSASIVGNAFKTIFSRFEQLKTEGTDGEVTLGRVSKQLKDLGVDVLDSSGELMKLDTVIQNVGQSWDKYSQKQQLAIAQAVGGTRQYAQFLALMQNFDKYQKLRGIAEREGTDALESQYKSYQEGIEATAVSASEAWKQAFGNIFTEDSIKEFYEFLEDAGNFAEHLLKGLGGIEGIIQLIGAYLIRYIQPFGASVIAGVTTMFQGLSKTEVQMQNIAKQAQVMKASLGVSPQSLGADKDTTIQRAYIMSQNNIGVQRMDDVTKGANLAKIDVYSDTKTAMIEVNRLLQSKNEMDRVNGTYLKDQLRLRQELVNETIDEVANAQRELKTQQQLLELQQRIRAERTANAEEIVKNYDFKGNEEQLTRELNSIFTKNLSNIPGLNQQMTNLLDQNFQFDTSTTTAQIDNMIEGFINLKQAALEAITEMQAKGENANYDKEIRQLESLIAHLENYRKAKQAVADLASSSTAVNANEQALLKGFQALDFKNIKNGKVNVEQLNQSFQKMVMELKKDQNISEALGSTLDNIDTKDPDKLIDGFTTLVQILREVSNGAQQSDNAVEGININPDLLARLEQTSQSFARLVTNSGEFKGVIDTISPKSFQDIQLALTTTNAQLIQMGTQSLSSLGMILSMSQSITSSIKDGDWISAMTSITFALPMLVSAYNQFKEIFNIRKSMIALSELQATLEAGNLAKAAESLSMEQLQNAAKVAGVTLDKAAVATGMTKNVIAKLEKAEQEKITAELIKQNAVAAANPIIGILTIVIASLMVIATIWSAFNKARKKAITEDAENAQKRLDELKESQQAIEDNTKAVEENVAAWQAAKKTGINATEAYDNMTKSLTELNKALIASGINSEKLNSAMTRAIATGDMSEYNQLLKDAQKNYKANLIQQTATTNAKVMRDAQFGENAVKSEGKQVLNKYNFTENTQDVAKFRQEYQKLQQDLNKAKMKQAALDPEKNQKEWEDYQRNIVNTEAKIDSLSEVYNKVTENAEAAQQIITQAGLDYTKNFVGGFENAEYMLNDLYAQMQQQGERIGLTAEEINNSFRMVVSGNKYLNETQAELDQLASLQGNIITKQLQTDQGLITEFEKVEFNELKKLETLTDEQIKRYAEL